MDSAIIMVAMANLFMRSVMFFEDGYKTLLPLINKDNDRLGLQRQTGNGAR